MPRPKVNYICPNCGYSTHKKSNYESHINRKNICSSVCYDKQNVQINEQNVQINEQNVQINEQNIQINEQNNEQNIQINEQNNEQNIQNNEHTCGQCKKVLCNKSSLKRHEKICKGVDSFTCPICLKRFITAQQKHYHTKNVKCTPCETTPFSTINNVNNNTTNNNTTNNNTINNITNNNQQHFHFHLNTFGNENYEYLQSNILQQLVGNRETVKNLIEQIHFNKDHPENWNMCVNNLRSKYAEIYDGTKFIVKDKCDVMHEVINKTLDFVTKCVNDLQMEKTKIEKILSKYTQMKKYIEYKDKLRKNQYLIDQGHSQSSNKDYDRIFKDAEMTSYNHRSFIK